MMKHLLSHNICYIFPYIMIIIQKQAYKYLQFQRNLLETIQIRMKPFPLKKTYSEGGASQNSNKSVISDRKGSKIPKQFTKQIKKSAILQKKSSVKMEDILKTAMSTFTCNICANSVDRADTLATNNSEKCGHRFCTDCLIQFAIYKINVSEQVLCPDQECNAKMDETSQLYIGLPQQLQNKWKQQQLWRQTINNPDIKICPNQDCKEGVVDLKKDPPECRKCQRKYCKECMMEAHQGPCDVNFQDHFRQWKRCPKCKIFIQKDQGCNHMTCNCGYEFCFVCLEDWESSHYQCIEGLNNRMCFNDAHQISSTTAILIFPFILLFFPFLIFGFIIIIGLTIGIGAALGILISPCILLKEMGPSCGIFAIIFLPFAAIVGAIGVPIALITTMIRPFLVRNMTQYCNTVSFLKNSI